jgi:hypothetical protein
LGVELYASETFTSRCFEEEKIKIDADKATVVKAKA